MGSDSSPSSDPPELARELEALRDQITTLEDRVEDLEQRLTECESRTTETNRAADAALKKADANKDRVRELQGRELEKGAHLRTETVDPHEIYITSDRLEKLTRDDGRTYYRVPDSSDPLDRTDGVALAHGDLLPIQQLARMDADMRRSTANSLPTRLAAKLWQARTDPTIGDDPWTNGCKSVAEYVTAGDLKHWIRRQEDGISETYAKKLVSRTIDAILELSTHRLAVSKRTQRKNGLEYTERRLFLPTDADIPGETTGSSSTDVTEQAASGGRENDSRVNDEPTSSSATTASSGATSTVSSGATSTASSSATSTASSNSTTTTSDPTPSGDS